jgi:hypothetical protein
MRRGYVIGLARSISAPGFTGDFSTKSTHKELFERKFRFAVKLDFYIHDI